MIRLLVALMLSCIWLSAKAEAAQAENAHDCFIVPMTVTNVGSPVRGVVEQLLVDRSDTVKRGQAIARLESGTERFSVTHAQARAEMQSELAAREADLELARLELDRIEDMHRQRMAPTQQRDEARVRRRVAQAGLVQALENQKLTQIELQRAQHELEQRTLRSPVDGVVVETLIQPGEFIYDEPVMSIAALTPLRVEVVLPARLIGSIKPGSQAQVVAELDPDVPLTASVEVVDRLLDSRSGTFGVRLKLPNADLAITAGQKCSIDFEPAGDVLELAEDAG